LSDTGSREDRNVRLIIGKQRNGPRGEIDMTFQTRFGRFIERPWDQD
ncbi:MAG: hypothetical protein IT351_04085, partial [Candidatus Fermentibacter sp.]|nr:hypothetical protein [Candidatus Fermentibacter sp.]